MKKNKSQLLCSLSIKAKLIALILTVFLVSIVGVGFYIYTSITNQYYTDARLRVERIAEAASISDLIVDGLEHPNDTKKIAQIQQTAKHLQKMTSVSFIVVIDMQGIRKSHANHNLIGLPVEGGDEADVLKGKSYISQAKGTLGFSIRAFKPIFSENKQIGAVIVGITVNTIELAASKLTTPILLSLASVFAISICLAILLSKNIKNSLLGFEPVQMTRLYEEMDAILHTVREGIIVINKQGEITLINDGARRILKIEQNKDNIISSHVTKWIPNTRLLEVIKSGKLEYDCEQKINGSVILTTRHPLYIKGELIGAVATFRDMTEVRQLAENLTGVKRYADALRSQSHEFLNKIHVINGLINSCDKQKLIDYVQKIIGSQTQELHAVDKYIKDPIVAGFLQSKYSRARELDVGFNITAQGVLFSISNSSVLHSIITILGNLIDNSLDAVQCCADREIDLEFNIKDDVWEIIIQDSGEGIDSQYIDQIFNKGFSTKGESRGFGLYLVLSCIDELNGKIEVSSSANEGTNFHLYLPLSEIYKGA